MKRQHILLFVLFCAAVLMPGFYKETSTTQLDEFVFVVPRTIETIHQGNFLIPYFEGYPDMRKPPLIVWAIVLCYKLFSISLFGARLPIIIITILTVLVIVKFARLFVDDTDDGIKAGLLFLTMAGTYIFGRIASLEMPLIFFTVIAYFGLGQYLLQGKRSGILLCMTGLGFAFMTKTSIVQISIFLFIILWILIERNLKIISNAKKEWLLGIILFIIIASPWYLLMFFEYKSGFVTETYKEVIVERFFDYLKEGRNILTLINGFITWIMPWGIMFIVAFIYGLRKIKIKQDRFLFLWLLVTFLPVLLMMNRSARYLFVALPTAAILIIRHISVEKKPWQWSFYLTGLLIAILVSLYLWLTLWFKITSVLIISAGTVLIFLFIWALVYRKDILYACIFAGLGEMVLFGLIYPKIGINRIPDELIEYATVNKIYTTTFTKEPGFLAIKIKRPLTNIDGSWQLANYKDKLINVRSSHLPNIRAWMNKEGFKYFKVRWRWTSLKGECSSEEMVNSIILRNLDLLKENVYILSNFK